jgi:hypothetical protein
VLYEEEDICMSYEEEDAYLSRRLFLFCLTPAENQAQRSHMRRRIHACHEEEDTCMSYEEEDTCMSYEEEDTCMSYEEEDTCISYEEEDTYLKMKINGVSRPAAKEASPVLRTQPQDTSPVYL